MMDKAARDAAQRRLDDAVNEYFVAMGWKRRGILTAWALISSVAHVENGKDAESYPIVYMHGELPDHTARGLFSIADDIVRGVGRWGRDRSDEDDDG